MSVVNDCCKRLIEFAGWIPGGLSMLCKQFPVVKLSGQSRLDDEIGGDGIGEFCWINGFLRARIVIFVVSLLCFVKLI
jgi:ABC-type methionine transport system permease subunit